MLLREEQSHAQRQQLPALQEEEETRLRAVLFFLMGRYSKSIFRYPRWAGSSLKADLYQGVVVRRPAIGLLDQLTVHLILELRVRQAHLQCILSQRGVVVDGRRLHQHVDEELARLGRGGGGGRMKVSLVSIPTGGTACKYKQHNTILIIQTWPTHTALHYVQTNL